MDFFIAQLAVAQPADRVILIKALLGFGRGFHIPLDHFEPKTCGHLLGKLGFPGARFAFDQQGPFKGNRSIYCNSEIVGGDIVFGSSKLHDLPCDVLNKSFGPAEPRADPRPIINLLQCVAID